MNKKYVVVIPPCMIAPGLQAEYNDTEEHWGNKFTQILLDAHVDILTLPCVESTYGGYSKGLLRKKHGIDYYLAQENYYKHCKENAIETSKKIVDIIKGGYTIVAIMGVEHSPNCAINYMYSHRGMLKRKGIFMTLLEENLCRNNLEVTYIGINRKYPRKALEMLKKEIELSIN